MIGTSRNILIIAVFLALLCGALPTVAHAQDPNAMFGLFGTIVKAARADQMQREWQKRPVAEYDCLTQHGTSVDALVASGVGPYDPRVRRIIAECNVNDATIPEAKPPAEAAVKRAYNSEFMVDGFVLGEAIDSGSRAYKSYSCRPSKVFAGFAWCSRKRLAQGKFGRQVIANSILRSQDNLALYVSQWIGPAFFRDGDIDREIKRLSEDFGLQAHVLRGQNKQGLTKGVIATWGDVVLSRLSDSAIADLGRGKLDRSQFFFDFLGDEQQSAREGLPVYAAQGGPGYIWRATFDENGKGTLRIVTINPNALGISSVDSAAASESATTSSEPASEQSAGSDEQVHIAREKAQRLEKLVSAAKQLVEDSSAFIKTDPRNPKLLDYVEHIAALKGAIDKNDPDEIERKSADLSTQLSREPAYHQLQARRAEEQRRAAARFLGDAIELAQRQKNFMLDYISKNPADPEAPKFVPLIKQLEAMLVTPELAPLQTITAKIDLNIREANLENDYIATVKESLAKPANSVESTLPALSNMPLTDQNRFLVQGDLGDIVFLYNASPNAPHVARNLRGDFVFSEDRADVCVLGKNPEGFALTVSSALAKFHPRTITGANQPCDPSHLVSYDIVATQRGAFLQLGADEALSLLKSIQTGDFRELVTITAAQLKEADTAEKQKTQEIAADVARGTSSGFGIILLTQIKSPKICMVIDNHTEAHLHLLLAADDKIAFEMHASPTVEQSTMESAFEKSQKAGCGAIYASAKDLKATTEALTRQHIPFSFGSTWITTSEVEAAQKAVEAQRRASEEHATERARKATDEANLRAQREADRSATTAAKEEAFRSKYKDTASAEASNIANDVKVWTDFQSVAARAYQGDAQAETELTALKTTQKDYVGSDYPGYATWLRDQLSDHWEVMSFNFSLDDFGRSSFKGRPLDTTFVRITLKLKNRMLGEYKDACFVFGRMIDTEFSMAREPIVASCDNHSGIDQWKDGNQFKSLWIVK